MSIEWWLAGGGIALSTACYVLQRRRIGNRLKAYPKIWSLGIDDSQRVLCDCLQKPLELRTSRGRRFKPPKSQLYPWTLRKPVQCVDQSGTVVMTFVTEYIHNYRSSSLEEYLADELVLDVILEEVGATETQIDLLFRSKGDLELPMYLQEQTILRLEEYGDYI